MLARLKETQIWCLCASAGYVSGKAQQSNSGVYRHFRPGESCPSSPIPIAIQFSSYPDVPGAFRAAVSSLEFRMRVCE